MTERIAVVTGAGTGIGEAIACELGSRGFTVAVTDIDGERAAATCRSIEGARWSEVLDVTDASAASQLADSIVDRHGRLDVWVSNAGISHMARFVDVKEADFDQTLAVNLKGVFVCGQAAARAMRRLARGGVIINTASMAGKQGRVPFLSDYVASKFGVVGLTQAMALELAADGIRVNCVCPGFVATEMQERELGWEAELRGVTRENVKQLWIQDTPMGRLEQPEDVARAVGFLAGEQAGFITGEALAVNGGAFMD